MREFLKIWLTLIGIILVVISVIGVGAMLVSSSLFVGIVYYGVILTGMGALLIYHDLHKYD